MATLDSLIRLEKHHLDEKQKAMGELNALLNSLEIDLQKLEDEKEHEFEVARKDPALSETLPAYVSGYEAKKKQIKKAIANVEKQAEEMRDEIREVFAGLKKYEIVQRRRQEEDQKALNKKESDELDEIAIDQYMRKDD